MRRLLAGPVLALLLVVGSASPVRADTEYVRHCASKSTGTTHVRTATACASILEYDWYGTNTDYGLARLYAYNQGIYRLDIQWVKLWSRSNLTTDNYCSGDVSSCTGVGNEMDDFTGAAWSESLSEPTAKGIDTRCFTHTEMRWRVQWNQGGNWSNYQITNSYERYRC